MEMHQGFFALDGFQPEEDKRASPPRKSIVAKEATAESPKPRPAQKIETKPLTYKDYLRIHLGNKAAAMYWWERNEGRPQR